MIQASPALRMWSRVKVDSESHRFLCGIHLALRRQCEPLECAATGQASRNLMKCAATERVQRDLMG